MILFLQSWFLLLVYDVLNKLCRFQTLYGNVKRWNVSGGPAATDAVQRVCTALNYACVWYPKRVLCLQRSFVTTYVLRLHGIHAQMVLGAQTIPFKAHAWVEVEGQVINERSNVQASYAVWDRC
jgi:hypothetical protein